jgi:hypothetical protein
MNACQNSNLGILRAEERFCMEEHSFAEWLKDWLEGAVAFYAAIVATGALFLEIRRWYESGVRLAIVIMPEAKMFGGLTSDDKTYLVVNVLNRGETATTITHLVLFNYGSWWNLLRRKLINSAIVNNPGHHAGQNIPFLLEPGKIFHGLVNHEPELVRWIDDGWLFVGVIGSHADKPVLKRVRKPRLVITAQSPKE